MFDAQVCVERSNVWLLCCCCCAAVIVVHGSCAVCSPCCSCLVICGAEFGVVGGVHVVGCGARCSVVGVVGCC